uniref:Uncharacterized protein n=1 Tax=Sphaerodactylus townsendi TaxID=933632 RepID=A0ACB8FZW9_9SAUR
MLTPIHLTFAPAGGEGKCSANGPSLTWCEILSLDGSHSRQRGAYKRIKVGTGGKSCPGLVSVPIINLMIWVAIRKAKEPCSSLIVGLNLWGENPLDRETPHNGDLYKPTFAELC